MNKDNYEYGSLDYKVWREVTDSYLFDYFHKSFDIRYQIWNNISILSEKAVDSILLMDQVLKEN